MRKLKLVLLAGAVAAIGLGLAACGGDDDDDGASETAPAEASFDLTVGFLFPLTGDIASLAPPGIKAAELAVEQANEALEEVGVDVTVTLEQGDTESRSQAAGTAARQLISSGASCIGGALSSANTIPVGQTVAARQQVPLISPASTSPDITDLDDDGFVFRTVPSDVLQGQALAQVVEDDLGVDAVVSMAARNEAGTEGAIRQFEESWEAKGGQTTGPPLLYDPELTSYNSEAEQIVEGDPDAFVIIDFEDPYSQLGAALLRTGGFDASKMYTIDGLAFDEIPSSIPTPALEGASGTRPASPAGTPAAEAFDEQFASAPGPQRGTYDVQSSDAVTLCVLAAVAAGSNDGAAIRDHLTEVSGPPGEKYDSTQLAEAIRALLDGEEIDFDGVSGPIDLDDNGDPAVAVYDIWTFEDSVLTVSDQIEVEAGS